PRNAVPKGSGDSPFRYGFPLECERDRELGDDRRPAARHSFCWWGRAWYWIKLTYPAAGAGQSQPTEDHADQPHHQGHDAPAQPVARADTTVGGGHNHPPKGHAHQPPPPPPHPPPPPPP